MVNDSDEIAVDEQLIKEVEGLDFSSDEDIIKEDYEEDDGSQDPVVLGFVENPKHKWSLNRRFFPSKAGGVPAWLDPVDLPTGRSSTCDICGSSLQFLLQVYAPLSHKESTFHRTLFVFVCTSMKCLIQHQRNQQNLYPKTTSRSVKVFRCQLPRTNPYYSYDPPKHDGADETPTAGAVASKLLWPEKEIIQEDEDASESDRDSSQNDIDIDSYVPDDGLDDTSTNAFMDASEADDDKKSWAAFQERIGKAPEQVLRYCRTPGAKPLWPMAGGRPSQSNIPKCNNCGGELSFEFQILPQLLYYFGVQNDMDSIDWETIAVYTCQASCDEGPSYKEEFAWVQLSSQS